jgi:hypothetical protein
MPTERHVGGVSSQVKEHKRKQNKELKAKLKTKKKPPKMLTAPAVPSGWPFKEQVMAEFEHLKAKEVADEAAKKAERKARKVRAPAKCAAAASSPRAPPPPRTGAAELTRFAHVSRHFSCARRSTVRRPPC